MPRFLRYAYLLALPSLLQACSQGRPANKNAAPSAAHATTANEFRAQLLQDEQCSPSVYLMATGASFRNARHQLVLEGHLVNNAVLATYKDPVLLVAWYSAAHTKLGTKKYPLRALVGPQGSAHFEFGTSAPSSVVMVALGIETAASTSTE